ncbi:ABC transporter permease [Nonomuraea antimicrobica]
MTQDTPRSHRILREISGGNAVVSVLAIGLALLVGSVLIVLTDPEVQAASGYLFARPADAVLAAGDAVAGACSALFQGAVFNGTRVGWANQIKPLTETLTLATPLIAAGLGVSVAFRSGMFNIGGRGQMLVAAAVAGWISWSFPMPYLLHLLVCVLGAIAGGALWGGIAGVLKARTGAHEVIVTIMLNYVAFYLVSFLLRTPGRCRRPVRTTRSRRRRSTRRCCRRCRICSASAPSACTPGSCSWSRPRSSSGGC